MAAALQAEHQPAVAAGPKPPALPFRVGHGFDLHRLEPGLPLIIGGISIPHDRGCDAHSDGACRLLPLLVFFLVLPFVRSLRYRACGNFCRVRRGRASALRGGRDSWRPGAAGHRADLPGHRPPVEGRRVVRVHEGSCEFLEFTPNFILPWQFPLASVGIIRYRTVCSWMVKCLFRTKFTVRVLLLFYD